MRCSGQRGGSICQPIFSNSLGRFARVFGSEEQPPLFPAWAGNLGHPGVPNTRNIYMPHPQPAHSTSSQARYCSAAAGVIALSIRSTVMLLSELSTQAPAKRIGAAA
jgi:hypothetical protein